MSLQFMLLFLFCICSTVCSFFYLIKDDHNIIDCFSQTCSEKNSCGFYILQYSTVVKIPW